MTNGLVQHIIVEESTSIQWVKDSEGWILMPEPHTHIKENNITFLMPILVIFREIKLVFSIDDVTLLYKLRHFQTSEKAKNSQFNKCKI